MKKNLIGIIVAIATLLMTSCEEKIKTITVSVKVDDTEITDISLPESYEVSITNFATAEVITANTENGTAVFADIVPGLYKVNAVAVVVDGGFNYTLTGSVDNADFLEQEDAVTVKVFATKESALIFKEIYYCGAKGDNYYFRDQFYEIYNNGNETVYADGLCIAETFFANWDFSVFYEFDIPDAENYVFTQKIWQLPGNGKDYPIKPGESFVIAQWATDHTDATLSNGYSPVNLKGAEFEAFCGESTTWTGITLTDEAALNMTMVVNATGYNMPQWLTSVSGSTYILFQPSTPLRTDNFIVPVNASTGSENAHEILISDIIDGVQTVSDETRLQTLGLPAVLDAGAIWCSGIYVGESIIRKIKETREDGRIIYQDTNNTSNDFEVKTDPQVRRNGEGVPSWNTWITK